MRKLAIRSFRPLRRLSVVILLSAFFTIGCGDNLEVKAIKEQTAEETIRATIDAFKEGDAAAFLDRWTDAGLMDEFGYSRDQIVANPDQFFVTSSNGSVRIAEFRHTDVEGDRATVEFEVVYGEVVTPQRYSLVIQEDAWRIDSTLQLPADLPLGTTGVPLNLVDFAFQFNEATIPAGNFAFVMDNVGKQPHEAILLSVPEDYTIQQLFESQSPDLPEGVSFVGAVGPFKPGERGRMVFSRRPSPGVYMLLCFLPDSEDPEGTPHAFKGMAVRFLVP
jgi:hypothetical protein